MKNENKYEGTAIVEIHLNGGFSKILLEKTLAIGMANGGIKIEIQTDKIPLNLRKINSRFYLEIKKNDDVLIKDLEKEKL